MVKYKEYFTKMLEDNKEAFDSFAKLHLEYSMNEDALQARFNDEGGKIMDIVRDYEDRLCRNTERGVYNKFSGGLSEKFQELVRSHFPLIDHVGLIAEPQSPQEVVPAYESVNSDFDFSIKKIDLS